MEREKIVFVSILILLFSYLSVAKENPIRPYESGTIRGTVLDENGARIITAEIAIENQSYDRQIKVNDAGEFELSLPQGAYEIKISAQGFCPFRRKEVIVKANDVLILNTTLIVGSSNGCLNRAVFNLIGPTEVSDYIGITYVEKTEGYKTIEYRGGVLPSVGDFKVGVGYRGIHLTADKVILNTQTFDLVATGNVVVDDGKKKQRLNEITLKWGKEIKRLGQVIIE